MRAQDKKLRVLVVRKDQEPVVEEKLDLLAASQALVQGNIEYLQLRDDIDCVVNEEGLYDCQFNRKVRDADGNIYPLHGDFFLVSHDNAGGGASLTDGQLAWALEMLRASA